MGSILGPAFVQEGIKRKDSSPAQVARDGNLTSLTVIHTYFFISLETLEA